ncbi:uncharacterized protein [Watersipora subatra]|uniref:uncharacterized protein isoform X2 n=1 Tax=Watersipora subatra TaxID=2589382 RepID=UPI00355C145F
MYTSLLNNCYFDARRRETYDQSHIVLAKFSTRTAGQYELPYDSQVETKKNIVVYDDMTEILRFDNGRSIKTDATRLAKVLYTEGARCAISILRGKFPLYIFHLVRGH